MQAEGEIVQLPTAAPAPPLVQRFLYRNETSVPWVYRAQRSHGVSIRETSKQGADPMSTTTHTFPARERRVSFAVVAAIVVSLGLGAVGGRVITRALDSADATTVTPAATGWDVQKLGAMQGRQLAASFAVQDSSEWDPQKIAPMQGRERAEALGLMGRSAP
jgi:hypothetical protein